MSPSDAEPAIATPPVATASPSPAASSQAPPAPAVWERSPEQLDFEDNGFAGVTWTGTRFLATTVLAEDLFDSEDGRTWHRQVFDTTQTSGPELVAAGPDGVLAMGGGDGFAVMWVSGDGLAWSQLPDQAAFHTRGDAFGGPAALVPTGGGWLGVGGEYTMNAPTLDLLRGVVLVSADGSEWRRVPSQPSLRHAQLNDAVRTPSGYVAVGAVVADPGRGNSGLRAAAWASPDGVAWTRLDRPGDFPVPAVAPKDGPVDVVLASVAALGERLAVVGSTTGHGHGSGGGSVMAWQFDGRSWTSEIIQREAPHAPLSVMAVPGAFYAFVGGDQACPTGAWDSSDGSTWQCLSDPVFEGFELRGVAAAPDRMVLVGMGDAGDDSSVAAAWTKALP